MALKIIGAGFGRAGTLSLNDALEQLGFAKCYHMDELFRNQSDLKYFIDAKDGRNVDWDTLFQGYDAAVDWPTAFFYKQLMDKYPDAKIILNVLDPEKWYESALETRASFERGDNRHVMFDEAIWNDVFDGKFLEKRFAITVFDRHIADVKAHVPPDKLLIFETKDEWEPLCRFLNVDVPDTPFPYANTRESQKKGLETLESSNGADENLELSPITIESSLARSMKLCTVSELHNHGSADEEAAGLQIIGAGFGRTGTLSLKVALEQLGYMKCYHMKEAVEQENSLSTFLDAMNGKDVDWDAVFRGYKATVDWPACTFYKQLMSKYPEAKVILSVRDPERWYQSAHDTIYAGMSIKALAEKPVVRQIDDLVWKGTFHGRFDDKKHAIEVFEKHNAEVMACVPPEKLLIFSVKDGWEPLCSFLGKPIPDGPFPHLNDREVFKTMLRAASDEQ